MVVLGLTKVVWVVGGIEGNHIPHVCRRTAGHGCPLARPLFLGWPADPAARVADRQWLMGDSVLITPVVEEARAKATSDPGVLWSPAMGLQEAPRPWCWQDNTITRGVVYSILICITVSGGRLACTSVTMQI